MNIVKQITVKQATAIRAMGLQVESATKNRDSYVAGVLSTFDDVPASVTWAIGTDDTGADILTLTTPNA